MSQALQRLILIRHAQALAAQPEQRDFDRELSPRGQQEAELAGQWLQQEVPAVDMVLCSPACRTRQTLEALKRGGWTLPAPLFESRLYDATLGMLLAVIEDTAKAYPGIQSLAVIAHNPGLEELLFHLTPTRSRYWQGMSPATVALLSLTPAAPLLAPGSATLSQLRTP